METKGSISLILVVLMTLATVVSPSYGHPQRRYDPSHKPAWRPVAHSHETASQASADVKGTNPIRAVAGLIGGVYKAAEGTLKAVLNPAQDAEKTQKTTSPRSASPNRTGFLWGQPGRK